MKRLLGTLLLCAVLILTATLPAAAMAATNGGTPNALWKEFPLEPAATPAPAGATAGRPGARPAASTATQKDDGMSSVVLAALLAAAVGLGAIARLTIRRRGADAQPWAVSEARPWPPQEAQQAPRAAEPKPAAPRAFEPKPAAPRAAEPKPAALRAFEPRLPARPARPATTAPGPQRLAPAASHWDARTGAGDWEECRIKLHSRTISSHFYAVPHEDGPVLARSPHFKERRDQGEGAVSAPEALQVLVAQLTASGWHQTGTGRAPWDLRFDREPVPVAHARSA